MIFTKDLLVKGMAAFAVCGSVAGTGYYYREDISNFFGKDAHVKLAEKVWLTCDSGSPTETTAISCERKEGISENTTNVKQENDDFVVSSTIEKGKIKVYKANAAENYNENFKFVIEGGDISSGSNKLEEFETYEITEEGGKYYLTRKEKAFDEIKKALGLPTENCNKPENNTTPVECTLDEAKLKEIKFEGKGNNETTVHDATTTPNLVSKIVISSGQNTSQYPLGYKFILESNKNISFGSDETKHIKKDTNTEFKIKRTGTDDRTLTLEKFWNPTNLGTKAGLSCADATNKECTLTNGSINVHNGGNHKYSGLSKTTASNDKKVKYEENVEGHNQGIKFYVETEDICLQDSNSAADDNKKIEKKGDNNSVSYEIKQESTTWYLFKKSATH